MGIKMTDQSTEEKVAPVENIFEEQKVDDQKTTSDQEVKISTDNNKAPDLEAVFNERLSTIVDDRGEPKYKDVFTALEALNHSQRYIKTLEEENKLHRETKMEKDTLEQAFSTISAKNNQQEPTKTEGVDAEQLKQMIAESLKEEKTKEIQESNKLTVSNSLIQKYGNAEKAKQAYQNKADELGIDVTTLVELAASSPKAVLAYFGSSDTSYSKTTGSINTEALKPIGDKPVDYTSRYFNSSGSSVHKWKEAGEGLNN
jgi:hypothetical protein